MLNGAIPLFTVVTALAFLRQEPIKVRSVGGTLLGFLGILLVARPCPFRISPLVTHLIGFALVILLATTDLHGIGAVFGDTRAALGLGVVGLGAVAASGVAYISRRASPSSSESCWPGLLLRLPSASSHGCPPSSDSHALLA